MDNQELKPRMMMGRLANGFQGGYGTKIHLTYSSSYCHGKSLCGKSPGRRSAGWSPADHGEANCPQCLAKLKQITNHESQTAISD